MTKNKLNVLSCFDGISCGRVALERAGIEIDKYYSSEIDKHAIAIASKNYPDTIQLGNINDIEFENYAGKIDLLIGGSPCTNLSSAGDRTGLAGEQSRLFFKFIEALEKIKPKYFLLENVASMTIANKNAISSYMKVEPIEINSNLVSAQNRKRLYWTNIEINGLPVDKNIKLKDILLEEDQIEEKYYINNIKEIKWIVNPEKIKKGYTSIDGEKAMAMRARQYANWNGSYIKRPLKLIELGNGAQGQRVYSIEGNSVSISALGGGWGARTGLYLVASRGRNIVDGKRKDILHAPTQQQLESRDDEKTNCLTTVSKDNYLIIELDGKFYRIRKLTPIECERLQTLPDNYTDGISDSQRWKTLGNGWTVDIITHILKGIKQ